LKGPVGKGLGITPESKGVHFAFTAGTGILVFMDLVTRIYLSRIQAIPKEERLHPLFKFVLYPPSPTSKMHAELSYVKKSMTSSLSLDIITLSFSVAIVKKTEQAS